MSSAPSNSKSNARVVWRVFTILWCLFCLFGCVWPTWKVTWWLTDPALRQPGIPRLAWDVHPGLSDRFAEWANDRLHPAAEVADSPMQIADTEWPLFSTSFYIRATSAMQEAWDKDASIQSSRPSPKIQARAAIDAAASLAVDPRQAMWVRKMWGDDLYLRHQNLFYRFLVVTILTEHAALTGSTNYQETLRQQVTSLVAELRASPVGWLPDYPKECYPADVAATVAAIRRADRVLGTDHAAFVIEMERGFTPERMDRMLGLPGFNGSWISGESGRANGCGSAWFLLNGPDVWRPELSRQWYGNWEKHFWSHSWKVAGWREYPKYQEERDEFIDGNVDAGPIVFGLGTSASAFGLGTARAHGRFDHAWPLSAQAVGLCWPLAGYGLPLPRLASTSTHAPYTGEASLLFALTRQPATDMKTVQGGGLTAFALVIPLLAWLTTWLCCRRAWRMIRKHFLIRREA